MMHFVAASSGSLGEAFVPGLSERLIKLNSLLQGLALSALAQRLNDPSFSVHCVLPHPEQTATTGPTENAGSQGKQANSARHTGSTSQSRLPRSSDLNSATF